MEDEALLMVAARGTEGVGKEDVEECGTTGGLADSECCCRGITWSVVALWESPAEEPLETNDTEVCKPGIANGIDVDPEEIDGEEGRRELTE